MCISIVMYFKCVALASSFKSHPPEISCLHHACGVAVYLQLHQQLTHPWLEAWCVAVYLQLHQQLPLHLAMATILIGGHEKGPAGGLSLNGES